MCAHPLADHDHQLTHTHILATLSLYITAEWPIYTIARRSVQLKLGFDAPPHNNNNNQFSFCTRLCVTSLTLEHYSPTNQKRKKQQRKIVKTVINSKVKPIELNQTTIKTIYTTILINIWKLTKWQIWYKLTISIFQSLNHSLNHRITNCHCNFISITQSLNHAITDSHPS